MMWITKGTSDDNPEDQIMLPQEKRYNTSIVEFKIISLSLISKLQSMYIFLFSIFNERFFPGQVKFFGLIKSGMLMYVF